MEDSESSYGVRKLQIAPKTSHHPNPWIRRSHLPDGVKSKSWTDRMQKTQKAKSIKMLEANLKEEKQAEINRSHRLRVLLSSRVT